jgi:adenine deaminase
MSRLFLFVMPMSVALRFGESKQLGRIAAGFQANLVVLKDDPNRPAAQQSLPMEALCKL